MKRNTALRWIGWLTTFAVVSFTSVYQNVNYGVRATVAHYQYDFPLPINVQEVMQAHPDVRYLGLLYTLGILALLAMLVGGILVALFGEAKADKSTAK